MAKDYYGTLGVSRDASQADIKKAFRKLAHQHHPDKASGDEAKFKEINEAYQVLGNEQKRKQYDQFGSAFDQTGGAPGAGGPFGGFDPRQAGFGGFQTNVNFEDLGDMFGDMFGMGGARRTRSRVRRGSDLEAQTTISFDEAAHGTSRDLDLAMSVRCTTCSGTGADPDAKIVTCETCRGNGRVEQVQQTILGSFRTQTVCPTCGGEGTKPERVCPQCRGTGAVRERVQLTVKIPAGVRDGQTLRLSGKGEAGDKGGPPGDLFIGVRVETDARFARDEDDVLSEITVPYATAALGGSVDVPTIDGDVTLKVPASTPSGKLFRLKGKGFPHLGGRGNGDHLVTVQVAVPVKLSKRAKQLLKELDDELS